MDPTSRTSAPEPPRAPDDEAREAPSGGRILKGTSVSPGLALGRVHRKGYDLARVAGDRVPLDQVDRELNRFRRGLDESRTQLDDLKRKLEGRVQEQDARILDTHLTYLEDSVFIADVENLILNEQMRLEAAIAKVVSDFDRIFRLVQNDTLRQSAIDLRDVGIRVLRNLENEGGNEEERSLDYVLVSKDLSIVDMFNLANEHVSGIVTQEGSLSSHAAIFARSMRIPTVIGVEGLLAEVEEGDFVILDASEGVLRVNPDDALRSQYAMAIEAPDFTAGEVPDWALREPKTSDGVLLEVAAACGNLPEVEHAAALDMASIGVYRTELLFLVDQELPSREALVRHYRGVVDGMQGRPVTFRLLNLDSAAGVRYLHEAPEANPALGNAGVRVLLEKDAVLRRQLQAILVAAEGASAVRIAIPFVVDCAEVRKIRDIVFDERVALRKERPDLGTSLEIGVVIETPAALLGLRDLAREADCLLVNLNSLQQYVLAADRENPAVENHFVVLHPFLLRAVAKACEIAAEAEVELAFFGHAARQARNLSLLIGAGVRSFCVPPIGLRDFLDAAGRVDSREAVRTSNEFARSSSTGETLSHVGGFRHGYAPG